MPYVSIPGSVSPLEMSYVISTPTCPSSTSIVAHLPTIIFIHSGYLAKQVFEPQFCDPQLRKFNLIAVDLRAYGETRGIIGESRYRPTETAEDLFQFMEALKLPPCHLFGLSIGTSVAMNLACAHPDRVISLTLCSPLTPDESEDVKHGRLQVYDYWTQGVPVPMETDETIVDEEVIDEMVLGVAQLLFNNETNKMVNAIVSAAVVHALDIWAGTEEKIKESYRSCISWFTERTPLTQEEFAELKGIKAVSIIHCSHDVGYPVENSESLRDRLLQVGIEKVELYEVPGPHYGSVTSAALINPILRDIILYCQEPNTPPSTPVVLEPHCHRMETPFSDLLAKYGYSPLDGSDSE